MSRRLRRAAACAALTAASVSAIGASTANAYVTTDITNFNLTESTSTYNGGGPFHISQSGGGPVAYRWVDSPSKPTVISGNSCSDLGLFGKSSYSAGATSYHQLFYGFVGQCFVLRGRTADGYGSMNLHDGRVRR